jgi:hypothetical protein
LKLLLKKIFYVYFWWSVLTPNIFNIYSVPIILDWVDEILQLILFTCWFLLLLSSKKKTLVSQYVKYLSSIFLLVTLTSAIVNKVSPFILLQFMIIYLRPVFLIMVSARIFSIRDVPLILKNLLILLLIQFILNFMWLIEISPIPHYKTFIDISTGTFESVAALSYMCIIVLYYIISHKTVHKFFKKNYFYIYPLMIATILQLFFTFTTHAIIIGSIAAISFVLFHRRYIYYIALSSLLMIFIMLVFQGWEEERFHAATINIIQPEHLFYDRIESLEYSIKYLSLRLVIRNEIPEIKYPWLGAGPGMYGSIVASRGSELYRKYNDPETKLRRGVVLHHLTSVTGVVSSGAIALLGDIGWLGYLIAVYINITILIIVIKFVRNNGHYSTGYPAIFIAFIPSLIFYLLLDVIWDLGNFKIMSIGMWVWAGILLKEIYIKKYASSKL